MVNNPTPMTNDTKKEAPKCKDCGQPMFEVGVIPTDVGFGMTMGTKTLYQCPEDKTIAIL